MDTTTRGPWRAQAAVAFALTVLAGGVMLLPPTAYADLDSSWVIGLTWWFQGKTHGSPVYFTYGPLGWLTETMGWARPEAVVALLFMFALTWALAWLLIVHLRRQLGWVATVLVTGLVLRLTEQRAETMATVVVLYCLLVVRTREWPRQPVQIWLGVACGVSILIKPGAGIMCLAAAVLLTLRRSDRLRSAAVVVVSTALCIALGWIVIGQPVGQLGPWVYASTQQMSGYWVMMAEYPGYGWEYPAMAILLAVFCTAIWAQRDLRWRSLALFVAFFYLMLKHGFVRHGDQGVQAVDAVAAVLVGALPETRVALVTRGLALRAAVVAVLGVVVFAYPYPTRSLWPGTGVVRALGTSLKTVALGGHWRSYFKANVAAVTLQNRLDPGMERELVGGTQVDPWSARTLWPDVAAWQPVPVFQQYTAYTPWLDKANAKAINGSHPPTSILRELIVGLDNRYLAFDAPAYQVAVVCHYNEVSEDAIWQLLRRTPDDRCGSETLLSKEKVSEGHTLTVPDPRVPGDVVVARFSTHEPLWYRAETIALKPTQTPGIDIDGAAYRLALTTLDDGLLVRVPPAGPSTLAGRKGLTVHTLRLVDAPASGSVSYYEISYH